MAGVPPRCKCQPGEDPQSQPARAHVPNVRKVRPIRDPIYSVDLGVCAHPRMLVLDVEFDLGGPRGYNAVCLDCGLESRHEIP